PALLARRLCRRLAPLLAPLLVGVLAGRRLLAPTLLARTLLGVLRRLAPRLLTGVGDRLAPTLLSGVRGRSSPGAGLGLTGLGVGVPATRESRGLGGAAAEVETGPGHRRPVSSEDQGVGESGDRG